MLESADADTKLERPESGKLRLGDERIGDLSPSDQEDRGLTGEPREDSSSSYTLGSVALKMKALSKSFVESSKEGSVRDSCAAVVAGMV